MVTSFNWDMGLGHPVATTNFGALGRVVAAGCRSILDPNWGSRNSHLIDGEAGIRSRTVEPTNSVVAFLIRPRRSTNADSRGRHHPPPLAALRDWKVGPFLLDFKRFANFREFRCHV